MDASLVPLSVESPQLASREAWQKDVSRRNGAEYEQLRPQTLNRELDSGDLRVAVEALRYTKHKGHAPELSGSKRMALVEGLVKGRDVPYLGDICMLGAGIIMKTPKVRKVLDRRDLRSETQLMLDTLPKFEVRARTGIERGVAEGYLPEAVRGRVDSMISQTKFVITDPAIAYARGKINPHYYLPNDTVRFSRKDQITVSNLMHELVGHKLSGGTFVTDKSGKIVRLRHGLSRSTPRISEALAEHTARSVIEGDFGKIDPDLRKSIGAYDDFRRLVATFVDSSQGIIDTKILTKASYEDVDPHSGSSPYRKELVQQCRAAYGPNALAKLERLCASVEKGELDEPLSAAKLQTVRDKIHSPHVDVSGAIVKQGWIDI